MIKQAPTQFIPNSNQRDRQTATTKAENFIRALKEREVWGATVAHIMTHTGASEKVVMGAAKRAGYELAPPPQPRVLERRASPVKRILGEDAQRIIAAMTESNRARDAQREGRI